MPLSLAFRTRFRSPPIEFLRCQGYIALMKIVDRLSSNKIRRLIGAVLAVAFFMTSIGAAPAMPASNSHQHPVDRECLQESSLHHGEPSKLVGHADTTTKPGQEKSPKYEAMGSCCVVACSPTIPVVAFSDFEILSFSLIRNRFHSDRFVGSSIPDGLFRPPRARA